MTDKLIYCETCGELIAKSARRCPHCGAKIRSRHSVIKAFIVTLIVIMLFCLIYGGIAGSKMPDKPFEVGETAKYNGISIKFKSVEEYLNYQYFAPSAGNEFLVCEFEIENQTDAELTVSSLLCFTASVDGYTVNLSVGAMGESGEKTMDGVIAPGKKLKGAMGYEIPRDWLEFEIKYHPDVFSEEGIIFKVKN